MFIFREKLNTILRKDKKTGRNIYNYNIVEEKEFGKPYTLGEKIEFNKKAYKVISIVKGNQLEDNTNTYIDIEKVEKNYQEPIKRFVPRDRMGDEVITNKDGTQYTIDNNGKKVRDIRKKEDGQWEVIPAY